MKSCIGCQYANWDKTISGRLHPSGNGQCTFEVEIPKLPSAKHWNYGCDKPPINGGSIDRRSKYQPKEPCLYYQPELK